MTREAVTRIRERAIWAGLTGAVLVACSVPDAPPPLPPGSGLPAGMFYLLPSPPPLLLPLPPPP